MSLLEWFFEPTNPGPIGKIEIDPPEPDDEEHPKRWTIWVAILTGLLLCCIGFWWVFYNLGRVDTSQIILKLCWLILYVLASKKITPKPDHSNVGWLGGLVDNPFRLSDDYNRWLIYLQAFLFPGKLIVYSLMMSWLLYRHFYKKVMK